MTGTMQHRAGNNDRAGTPTAMAEAFIAALVHFARRHPDATAGTITIPAGRVNSGELIKVVVALLKARAAP
jgi:hypothetical protein